jgi:hypothetical protein
MGYLMIVAFVGAYPLMQRAPVEPKIARPAIVFSRPKITLKPGQPCAIPLLNVLRRNWGSDRMAIPVPRWPKSSAEVILPPAPSCDDVK